MTKEQENSINKLVQVLDKSYVSKTQLFIRSFLSGLFSALGATVGLTIVLFVTGYAINALGGLPLIGYWIAELNYFIHLYR